MRDEKNKGLKKKMARKEHIHERATAKIKVRFGYSDEFPVKVNIKGRCYLNCFLQM